MLHPCFNRVQVEKQCLKDVTEEVTELTAPLCLTTEPLHRLQSVQGEGKKAKVKTDEESSVRKRCEL